MDHTDHWFVAELPTLAINNGSELPLPKVWEVLESIGTKLVREETLQLNVVPGDAIAYQIRQRGLKLSYFLVLSFF